MTLWLSSYRHGFSLLMTCCLNFMLKVNKHLVWAISNNCAVSFQILHNSRFLSWLFSFGQITISIIRFSTITRVMVILLPNSTYISGAKLFCLHSYCKEHTYVHFVVCIAWFHFWFTVSTNNIVTCCFIFDHKNRKKTWLKFLFFFSNASIANSFVFFNSLP